MFTFWITEPPFQQAQQTKRASFNGTLAGPNWVIFAANCLSWAAYGHFEFLNLCFAIWKSKVWRFSVRLKKIVDSLKCVCVKVEAQRLFSLQNEIETPRPTTEFQRWENIKDVFSFPCYKNFHSLWILPSSFITMCAPPIKIRPSVLFAKWS